MLIQNKMMQKQLHICWSGLYWTRI